MDNDPHDHQEKAPEPLSAGQMKEIEAGLFRFQQQVAENEKLKEKLRAAEDRIVRTNIELESLREHSNNEIELLKNHCNELESTARTHQLERDQAVADRASFETLFATFQAQLRVFKLPAVPLVKDHSQGRDSRDEHQDVRRFGRPVREPSPQKQQGN